MEYALVPVKLLKKLEKFLDKMDGSDTSVWKTARQTGMTREQLRYFRKTQPEKVRVAQEGKRSYLYRI